MAKGLQHPFVAQPQLLTVVQLPFCVEYAGGSVDIIVAELLSSKMICAHHITYTLGPVLVDIALQTIATVTVGLTSCRRPYAQTRASIGMGTTKSISYEIR